MSQKKEAFVQKLYWQCTLCTNVPFLSAKATEHGNYDYGYDDLYRLDTVDNPAIASLTDEAFTYDNVGNRLTAADTTGNWTYNQH